MKDKIKRIKLIALDVDGVLTDGKIVYDSNGGELKFFDVQDGFGIVLCRKAGLKVAILSARSAKPVTQRAKDLKVDRVYQNAYPKLGRYEEMLKDFKISDEQVCFVGDDLPDLPVLKRVGFPVAVANAAAEVKKSAVYVTKKNGGAGAVREVIELILKTQGAWDKIVREMSSGWRKI